MFARLGAAEVALIVVAAVLIFGPKKLPELGKSVGDSIRSFKKAINDPEQGENKA